MKKRYKRDQEDMKEKQSQKLDFFLLLKKEKRRQREAAHCKQKHVRVFFQLIPSKKKKISSLMSFYVF